MNEVIEGEVESTALAIIDQEPSAVSLRLGEFRLATYADVLNKAAEVSSQLADIIRDRKLFKRIGQKDHVYVDGWTTCGAMLGVAVRPVSCDENPAKEGEFIATVEAIRTSDGFILGRGIASCGPDERDWGSRSRQARRSMAQTRAAGKAMRLLFSWVMELAGYATTPFEELDSETPPEHPNPAQSSQHSKPAPRGKRNEPEGPPPPPPEITKEQCAFALAHWRADHPQADADVPTWNRKFHTYVNWAAKRDFDASKAGNWTKADFVKVCEAVGCNPEDAPGWEPSNA